MRRLGGWTGISALLGALGALAACGDNLAPSPDAGPQPGPTADEYQPEAIGLISLINGEVEASLRDRPEPLAPELRGREGACALYVRPTASACNPPCAVGDVCVAAGECAAPARPVSAGDITITGLRQRLVFRAAADGYQPESQPTGDLFDGGARIAVSAPGEQVAGFTAELDGVPRLDVSFSQISLRRGRDTRLLWTAAGLGRVAAVLSVGRPGLPFSSMLLCETDDYGDLTIPSSMAARLPAASGEEVLSAAMLRLRRAVIMTPAGPIEIVAGQKVAVGVTRE